jgi:light-regulated signal transduction histidine kinase (bacteriophytochrome)
VFDGEIKDLSGRYDLIKNDKIYKHFTPYIKKTINEKKEFSKLELLSLNPHSSEKKYYKWKVVPLTTNKQETFALVTIEDVSEKILLENNVTILKKHNEELENFSRICAHDLKEPLRSIYSFVELLEKENKDHFTDVSKNYLKIIYQSTVNLQNLIDKLGSYTKITARDQQAEYVDLDQVISDVTFLLAHKIYSSKAKIIHEDLDSVFGDRVMITQLLQNLIDNAIKYKGKTPPIIEITSKNEEDNIIVMVRDNGKGIKKEDQKKVFDFFVRGESSNPLSSGLGLSLCKKIMDRHNGKIWLKSDEDSGTIFYLLFKKHYLQR